MRLQHKIIRFGEGLRTGLLVVACFLITACLLAGCSSDDKLLSELRQEDVEVFDDAESTDEADGEQDGEDSVEGSPDSIGSTEKPEIIYVHVCGAVAKPGVYEMPAGSRFYEAVDKAGGFTEEACQDYLNMAASLADGSRLEIPSLQEIRERESAEYKGGMSSESGKELEYSYYTVPEMSTAEKESAKSSDTELVNINTADMAGLCALPGIGEGRAKAILEYREKQGGFQKKEDIMQVSGIGEKMYARMEEYLTVE